MPYTSSLLSLFLLHLTTITFALALAPPQPPTTLLQPTHNRTNPLHLGLEPPQCVHIPQEPMTGLAPSVCETASQILCLRLSRHNPSHIWREKWNWTELPGCAVAYWLPEGSPVPRMEECEVHLLGGIRELCATNSNFNGGVRNVAVLPDWGNDGTAVVEGEMRWLLAPERFGGRF